MATLYIDLDGTLIDVQRRHYRAYADALRELDLQPCPQHNYWSQRQDGAKNIDLIGDVDEAMRQAFLSRWLTLVESPLYLRLDTPLPAARRTLARLTVPHELVLVTLRRDRGALLMQLDDFALAKFFSAVHCCDEVRSAHAKPVIIRLAGRVEADAVVVGDSEADVQAARALGISSICVTTGVRSRRFLEDLGPDEIVQSLAQLPAALQRRSTPLATPA